MSSHWLTLFFTFVCHGKCQRNENMCYAKQVRECAYTSRCIWFKFGILESIQNVYLAIICQIDHVCILLTMCFSCNKFNLLCVSVAIGFGHYVFWSLVIVDLRRLFICCCEKFNFWRTKTGWQKQITYRQHLPNICVQQFHSEDKFQIWTFGSFWICMGKGQCTSKEFVKFAFLDFWGQKLQIFGVAKFDAQSRWYLRMYKYLMKDACWWNVVYKLGVGLM